MENPDWACFAEVHHTESTDFWKRPGVDAAKVKTECFLLPSFSNQLSNPCAVIFHGEMDLLADPADKRFPIVLTTYSMTEHWCGVGETRNSPPLLEAEPQLYVEMSPELAKEKGIKNGEPVVVESIREGLRLLPW